MSKVTSKLQVTLPKSIAGQYRIAPGDEIEWLPSGEFIRVLPHGAGRIKAQPETRLKLFDQATARQKKRQRTQAAVSTEKGGRGWAREDLYQNGRRSD